MEDELVVFKKKIRERFEKRDIAHDFAFPRFGTQLHAKIDKTHNVKMDLTGG